MKQSALFRTKHSWIVALSTLMLSSCLSTLPSYEASSKDEQQLATIYEDWIGFGKGKYYENSFYGSANDDVVSIVLVDGMRLAPIRKRSYTEYERAKIDPGKHSFRFTAIIEAYSSKGLTHEDEIELNLSGVRYNLFGEYQLEEELKPGHSYKLSSSMTSYQPIDGIYVWFEELGTGRILEPGKLLYHFTPSRMRADDPGTNSILYDRK